MRLPVDDEIYNVDAVWLGPPGKTLPFRARYVAYAIAALIFFLLQVLERRLGIGMGFFPLAYSLLVTAGLTRLVLAFVDHDRPVVTVLQAFINELTTNRSQSQSHWTMVAAHPADATSADRCAWSRSSPGGVRGAARWSACGAGS